MNKILEAQKRKHAQVTGSKARITSVSQSIAADTEAQRSQIQQRFDTLKEVLNVDLAHLKAFETIDDKLAYKSSVLDKNGYFSFVHDYVKSGANFSNVILVWCVIWLVDLKRFSDALQLLPTLISQSQKLPTMFKTKNWLDFVGDYLYDHATTILLKGREAIENDDIRELLRNYLALCEEHEKHVHKIVHGKVYAVLCKLEFECKNMGYARNYGVKAELINDEGAGVKKFAREAAKLTGIEINI